MSKKVIGLVILGIVLVACGIDKNTEYNPIGTDYNTVIEYFEENNLVYMRMVSDLNNNFLMYFDNSDTSFRNLYFNDDDMCYKFQWVYFTHGKKDYLVNWLNKNFKKMSNDSMKWIDKKNNLTYAITVNNDKSFSLWCDSEKYQNFNEQDNRLIIDYYNSSIFDAENDEWVELYQGKYTNFDPVIEQMYDLNFSTDRFIITLNDEGKFVGEIKHFQNQGKMRTYKIVPNSKFFYEDDNQKGIPVIDNDNKEFFFVLFKDTSGVMFIFADGMQNQYFY